MRMHAWAMEWKSTYRHFATLENREYGHKLYLKCIINQFQTTNVYVRTSIAFHFYVFPVFPWFSSLEVDRRADAECRHRDHDRQAFLEFCRDLPRFPKERPLINNARPPAAPQTKMLTSVFSRSLNNRQLQGREGGGKLIPHWATFNEHGDMHDC